MDFRLNRGISKNESTRHQGTILAYPDLTKKFKIHTYALDVQLGAVIIQEGKPLNFCSREWSKSQINYTFTETELINIVENLKEIWNILLGHKIEVLTYHRNINYERIESACQSVQRWKSLMQDFGVNLLYIKGEANVIANAFSWIPMVHQDHKLVDTTLEKTRVNFCVWISYSFLIKKTVSPST